MLSQERFKDIVATAWPQDESVRCADLRPVRPSRWFSHEENGPQGRGYSGYGFI